MTRLVSGVRAVLGRSDRGPRHGETDRLAATLAYWWARGRDLAPPVRRFVETGAVSDATVDALYEEVVALEREGPQGAATGAWTADAMVWALLEYAAVHRPRGAVPGWSGLRDERMAARVFGRATGPR